MGLVEVSFVQHSQLCTRLRTVYVILRNYRSKFESQSIVLSHIRPLGGGLVQNRILVNDCKLSSRTSDIVVKIYPCTLKSMSAEGYVASHVRDRGCTHSSCGFNTNDVIL